MGSWKLALVVVAGSVCCGASSAHGAVSLPKVFGDGMVLQRQVTIPVWGWDNPGQRVTVSFREQTRTVTTNSAGRWAMRLAPEEVGPATSLSVAGSSRVIFGNVQVGEVWLCSGQSNMQWVMAGSAGWAAEQAKANRPDLRLFSVGRRPSATAQQDVVSTGWKPSTSASAASFSAVCYLFGKQLHESLKVPVGLIDSSFGGTPIESWVTPMALYVDADVKAHCATLVSNEFARNRPGHLYNGMIHGLIPYAMRGAAWYQGESNAWTPWLYEKELTILIDDWRRRWGNDRLFFGIVQLADYLPDTWVTLPQANTTPLQDIWAWLRDSQLRVFRRVADTGLVVAADTNDPNPHEIHPSNKYLPGIRLALWALRKAYERPWVAFSGPVYDSYTITGNKVIIKFSQVEGGLSIRAGNSFKVAGADKVFHWAQAKVVGDTVEVSSAQVPQPVAARYAWGQDPTNTLYNSVNLPASPFRTDFWPSIDSPVDSAYPGPPSDLRADKIEQRSIVVSWNSATDDVGIGCYEVFVNSVLRFSTPHPSAVLQNLAPGTTYSVAVRARDGMDYRSVFAKGRAFTTLPLPTVFSPVALYGDRKSYAEKTPARWSVVEDQEELRYFLHTPAATTPASHQLGEYAVVSDNQFDDVIISARVRSAEPVDASADANYGVVLGYQDNKNYYYAKFGREGDTAGIYLVHEGVGRVLARAKAGTGAFADNAYHAVEFRREGALLSMSLDAREIVAATDTTLSSGLVGVGSCDASAYFDDVKVAIAEVLVCKHGLSVCGDVCVDLDASLTHCGGCDRGCDDDQRCTDGTCVAKHGGAGTDPPCEEGLEACGSVCANLAASTTHCGSCGSACDAGDRCLDGQCVGAGNPTDPGSAVGSSQLVGEGCAVGDAGGEDGAASVMWLLVLIGLQLWVFRWAR